MILMVKCLPKTKRVCFKKLLSYTKQLFISLYELKIDWKILDSIWTFNMAIKHDPDSSPGQKLLRMYQILFSEDKCHYQSELSKQLNCSAQTIMRLANEIEQSIPSCFLTGLDNGRRWYRLQAKHHNMLGLDYQELNYLSLCQELSKVFIPQNIFKRLDQTILKLSTLLLELGSEKLPYTNKPIAFFSKGKIDYSTHDLIIENLLTCIRSQYFCHLHYLFDNNPNGKNHYFIPKKLIAMNNALYVFGAVQTMPAKN